MTRAMEHCDDTVKVHCDGKNSGDSMMTRAMEHCDDRDMEHCDEKNSGAF